MEGLVNEQEQQQQQASQQQEQEGGGGGHGGGGGYPTKQRPPPAVTAVAVPQRPPVRTLKARRAYYTRADLEPFNLLEHPVWVFDIERKCMWWANDAALVVWNAPTLDALLARSFSDDMSQATTLRLSDYLRRFREHDEKIAESWTVYPKGVPTTVYLKVSGIRIQNDDGDEYDDDDHDDIGSTSSNVSACPRLAMFSEGDLPKEHDTTIQHAALRGMEMLRHLPVPVAQFDQQGRTLCENPESSAVFGATTAAMSSSTGSITSASTSSSSSTAASTTSSSSTRRSTRTSTSSASSSNNNNRNDSGDGGGGENHDAPSKNDDNNNIHKDSASCCSGSFVTETTTTTASMGTSNASIATSTSGDCNTFVARFVDRKLGEHIFESVLTNGQDYMGEVQQFTKPLDDDDDDHDRQQEYSGPIRWFAIKVRRSKDPITGQPVLLYSARDITLLHQARKEADEANLAKSEFMAIMAHEIRTPLHQVLGFMELLGETITKPNRKKTPQTIATATAASQQEQVLLQEQQQQQQQQQAQAQQDEVDFFNLMHDAAQSLYIVINDLMDYTKLEAGKMKLEYAPFEWRKVVNGCLSVMAPRAHAKGLVIEFLDNTTWNNNGNSNDRNSSSSNSSGDKDSNNNDTTITIPNMIVGDPNRIRQLLSNLLQNAVKFTHHGSIALSVTPIVVSEQEKDNVTRAAKQQDDDDENGIGEDEREDDSIRSASSLFVVSPPSSAREHGDQEVVLKFVVADTGIGLSPAHADKLFQKYQQADESIARTHGGTGLGLAICKSLVEAMGGSIGVESEIGLGSRFWFQVPFGLVRADHSSDNNNNSIDLPSLNNASTSLVPDKIAKSLHVLIVEDNLANQKLVTAMLKRLGHAVTVVDNGLKAVELIGPATTTTSSESSSNINSSVAQQQQHQELPSTFDMVLMDVQMPVMGGLEATERIRQRGWTCQTLPIVGLTADFRTAELAYYQKAGMNYCLGKPIRIKELKIFLQNIASKKDVVFEGSS